MFNLDNIQTSLKDFKGALPFDHVVIDNFFKEDIAKALSDEFLNYNAPEWYVYNNQIEHKKALNNWNIFPALTYKAFSNLNSISFTKILSDAIGRELLVDNGLHGGGWHMHGSGGNLNPHLDYSIHPKLDLQRKVNIIVYLSKELRPEHGGQLGLWTHCEETNGPKELIKEVDPIFNRAVIFDTTQNSWHGMSRKLTQPEGIYRKSLAIYYLCEPDENADKRGRALFAPRDDQKDDNEVIKLIQDRADVEGSLKVYRKDTQND